MKRILSMTGILALTFIFLSAFSIRENPQEPPRGKKAERHIKMVKVDEQGKKIELDTFIQGDQIFVWNGDTIGGGNDLKWISKDEFNMDSIHKHFDMDFEYEIDNDGEGNVFIMKSGKDGRRVIREFRTEGDSTFTIDIDKRVMPGGKGDMFWMDKDSGHRMIVRAPRMAGVPRPIHEPHVLFMDKPKKENIIDLSDPGIVSFKKKLNKDGTEKITIVRKQVEDKDIELEEDIILHDPGDVMFMPGNHPSPTRVKIIKSDDGNVEIIEDEKVWSIKEGDENVKIIEEDGNVIHIKEIKKDGEKNVEVKVEVEEEKENENN